MQTGLNRKMCLLNTLMSYNTFPRNWPRGKHHSLPAQNNKGLVDNHEYAVLEMKVLLYVAEKALRNSLLNRSNHSRFGCHAGAPLPLGYAQKYILGYALKYIQVPAFILK